MCRTLREVSNFVSAHADRECGGHSRGWHVYATEICDYIMVSPPSRNGATPTWRMKNFLCIAPHTAPHRAPHHIASHRVTSHRDLPTPSTPSSVVGEVVSLPANPVATPTTLNTGIFRLRLVLRERVFSYPGSHLHATHRSLYAVLPSRVTRTTLTSATSVRLPARDLLTLVMTSPPYLARVILDIFSLLTTLNFAHIRIAFCAILSPL